MTHGARTGFRQQAATVRNLPGNAGRVLATKNYKAYINYMIFTGIFDLPNYRRPMRYFFHILDGPKVYPDECGISFSGPELAVLQAKSLALELRKAGALCRSNLVLVLDETGGIIFNCWVRATSRTPPVHGKAKTQ